MFQMKKNINLIISDFQYIWIPCRLIKEFIL